MQTRSRSFAHLNLRFNPFGELDADDRASVAVVDIEVPARWFERDDVVVQIVGRCGRGKSTRLHAFRARFPEVPSVHIRAGERVRIPRGPALLLDGLDHIPPRRARRLLRRRKRLVFTVHRDWSEELRRVGRAFHTMAAGGTDEPTLLEIFRRRIEFARRSAGPVPTVSLSRVRSLRDRFGDDVRAMEGALYEEFQQWPSVT